MLIEPGKVFPSTCVTFLTDFEAAENFIGGAFMTSEEFSAAMKHLDELRTSSMLPSHGDQQLGRIARMYSLAKKSNTCSGYGVIQRELLEAITAVPDSDNFVPDWLVVIHSKPDKFVPVVINCARNKLLSISSFNPAQQHLALAETPT